MIPRLCRLALLGLVLGSLAGTPAAGQFLYYTLQGNYTAAVPGKRVSGTLSWDGESGGRHTLDCAFHADR